MSTVSIPHYATLELAYAVLDYNGTLAKDGEPLQSALLLLEALCGHCCVHVITSDTFGTVKAALKGFELTVMVLQSDDHTAEKAHYVETLGAARCACVGNGNNDAKMLETAGLGIALMGEEGCATPTLLASDIVCKSIDDALGLLLHDKRLIATLRR